MHQMFPQDDHMMDWATYDHQKTGASLKNILVSSDVTHLTTVLAAATTAALGNPGKTLMYSSNGLVI
jgi:hypothetical protein